MIRNLNILEKRIFVIEEVIDLIWFYLLLFVLKMKEGNKLKSISDFKIERLVNRYFLDVLEEVIGFGYFDFSQMIYIVNFYFIY